MAAVDIDPVDLACAWEDLADRGLNVRSWTLADRLIKEGVAGIVVPSFAHRTSHDDRNLIFGRWDNDLPYKVRVIDDQGRLPRDPSSWS